MKEKKKNNTLLKAIFNTITPIHLLILIVLISVNSFAWFIYANQVENNVSVHVRSWKILLEVADHEISSDYEFNVDDMYPGMTDYSQSIQVFNKSEMDAEIVYTILEANILGDDITTQEGVLAAGGTPTGSEPTSAALINKLATEYPFKISFGIGETTIQSGTGETEYNLSVKWPFESGNDSLDTKWGNKAYDYKSANPSSPSITMKVRIKVTQKE